MGKADDADIRISNAERDEAVRMLGEHLSEGRLDVEEYGERTARATAAKTRGELLGVFTDLPGPHPSFGSVPVPARPGGAPVARREPERPVAQRLSAAMVPLSAILAVVLYFSVFHEWYIFLLPAAVAVVSGAIWGEDRRHHHGRGGHRRHHRG